MSLAAGIFICTIISQIQNISVTFRDTFYRDIRFDYKIQNIGIEKIEILTNRMIMGKRCERFLQIEARTVLLGFDNGYKINL